MEKIKNDIKTGNFCRVYLLYGIESYMRDYYCGLITTAICPPETGEPSLNIWYCKENDTMDSIREFAETVPFLAERKLIVFRKSDLAVKNGADLAAFLKNYTGASYFIFVEESVDKRSSLYKTIAKTGYVTEFKTLPLSQLKTWVSRVFQRRNRNCPLDTAEFLIQRVGLDMNLLCTEIDKLECYTLDQGRITEQDIIDICPIMLENKIFDMIRAITEKNVNMALDLYKNLLTQKEPSMRILALLTKQFSQILLYKELKGSGYSNKEIADKCKVQQFIVDKVLRQAGTITMEKARRLLDTAITYEEDVKMGRLKDQLSVEMLILEAFED